MYNKNDFNAARIRIDLCTKQIKVLEDRIRHERKIMAEAQEIIDSTTQEFLFVTDKELETVLNAIPEGYKVESIRTQLPGSSYKYKLLLGMIND